MGVQHWFVTRRNVLFSAKAITDALIAAAHELRVNPVQRYLTGLKWDCVERLSSWLAEYVGASDSEYTRAVGQMWMVSAVARAMKPGTKVDHMLVLEGLQGSGKSAVCETLGGEWFLDSLRDLDSKDALQQLGGQWIVEIGELEALRSTRVTLVKNFLTSRVDEYRPPYARQKVKVPRSCVFVGTTNETEYLADATGARRYWPVPVGKVDLDKLKQDRDQLWAEALHSYRAGAKWWPTSDAVAETIAAEQESRYNADDWERVIRSWLRGRESVTNGETLEGALNLEPAKWDRRAQMRVGMAMRRLGWVKIRVQSGGVREWRYTPGADAKVR